MVFAGRFLYFYVFNKYIKIKLQIQIKIILIKKQVKELIFV